MCIALWMRTCGIKNLTWWDKVEPQTVMTRSRDVPCSSVQELKACWRQASIIGECLIVLGNMGAMLGR